MCGHGVKLSGHGGAGSALQAVVSAGRERCRGQEWAAECSLQSSSRQASSQASELTTCAILAPPRLARVARPSRSQPIRCAAVPARGELPLAGPCSPPRPQSNRASRLSLAAGSPHCALQARHDPAPYPAAPALPRGTKAQARQRLQLGVCVARGAGAVAGLRRGNGLTVPAHRPPTAPQALPASRASRTFRTTCSHSWWSTCSSATACAWPRAAPGSWPHRRPAALGGGPSCALICVHRSTVPDLWRGCAVTAPRLVPSSCSSSGSLTPRSSSTCRRCRVRCGVVAAAVWAPSQSQH